jgi:putative acetyltransferase
MPVSIRKERPDQPDVAALLQALDTYLESLDYPEEDNHILSEGQLLAADIRFFVARQDAPGEATDKQAVGCGALRLLGKGQGELKRMYVSPEMRGQKIGVALLKAITAEAKAAGITELLLETGSTQAEALRLYLRAGYHFCDPFGDYIAGHHAASTSVFLSKPV